MEYLVPSSLAYITLSEGGSNNITITLFLRNLIGLQIHYFINSSVFIGCYN